MKAPSYIEDWEIAVVEEDPLELLVTFVYEGDSLTVSVGHELHVSTNDKRQYLEWVIDEPSRLKNL